MNDLSGLVWSGAASNPSPPSTKQPQQQQPMNMANVNLLQPQYRPVPTASQPASQRASMSGGPGISPASSMRFTPTTGVGSTTAQPGQPKPVDAFDGLLGAFGAAQRQAESVSKLSLAEQQRLQQQQQLNSLQGTRSANGSSGSMRANSQPVASVPSSKAPSQPQSQPQSQLTSPLGVKSNDTAGHKQWDFDMMLTTTSTTVSSAGSHKTQTTTTTTVASPADDPFFSTGPVVSKPVDIIQSVPAADDPFGLFTDATATPKKVEAAPSIAAPAVAPIVVPVQASPAPVPPTTTVKSPAAIVSSTSAATKNDAAVARMVEIGFGVEESHLALAAVGGDIDAAAEHILSSRRAAAANNFNSTKKAERIISQASVGAKSLFHRAKNIVADSTKKISVVLMEQQQQFLGSRSNAGSAENVSEVLFAETAAVTAVPVVATETEKPRKKVRPSARVAASAQERSQSDAHREKGNLYFKQGQFGDAFDCYTLAINSLPESFMGVVPLLNNRAASQLKNGTYKEAVTDCSRVIELCLAELEFDDVSVAEMQEWHDALAKAFLRRATALENMEKWAQALDDYRTALQHNPNTKGTADGIRRCTKAVSTKSTIQGEPLRSETSAQPAPTNDSLFYPIGLNTAAVPKNSSALGDMAMLAAQREPHVDLMQQPSDAVEALRAQDRQNEVDDAEKLRVKDDVDAKLAAWRENKKANIRALISSLETILWAELKSDWKPVTLSELITPQQVKIRYMKAIAKLHPDKLSNMNLTVEQKMLANGIFSALNDAWDAFKLQNNLQ